MPHVRSFPILRYQLAATSALALAAGLLAGCPPVTNPPTTMPAAAATDSGLAPVLGSEPTTGGVYLTMGSYVPLSGDTLARALTDRPTILANTRSLPAPSSQPAPPPATAPSTTQDSGLKTQDSSEPPPLAVKYYLEGREQFFSGANSQAMDFLDKALALDPNAFTVLRLMGRVCFASSQLPRGSIYLQRAYSIHPTDVEVNYLLGRYYLERKDTDRAVSHLLQADDSPERSPSSAQTPLVSFYLARALQESGYHKVAAAEYERFLDTVAIPVAGYRFDRELNYLIDELWAVHISAAENHILVGEYAKAVPHYQAALLSEPKDTFILSRLVNAQVHAAQAVDARKTALTLVTTTQGNDESIKLLAWTYRVTGHEKDLLADLNAKTSLASDPASAITLAATQDYLGKTADAFDTLDRFFKDHPDNLNVLERLLKRIDSDKTFQRALLDCSAALSAVPDKHDDILKLFLPIARSVSARAFLENVGMLSNNGRRVGVTSYLIALTRRENDAPPKEVEADFRAALAASPDFFPARDAYVSFLLAQEQFKQATDLAQQAINAHAGPKAYQLLVECEGAQQRLTNALKIAIEAKQKFPDNPELRLQLSAVYRVRGQIAEADKELAALLDIAPKFESGYRALINSLAARSHDQSLSPADRDKVHADMLTILDRLVRALPDSLFGKINTAVAYANEGHFSEAELLLRRLLAEHPEDHEILVLLAQLRQIQEHPVEAAATLEEPLKKHADPELAASLASLYREQEKATDALALTDRLMKENPDNESFILVHAAELAAEKKFPDAIAVLMAASAKFPRSEELALDLSRLQSQSPNPAAGVITMQSFIARAGETAARLYTLAHLQSAAGQDAASEATLQKILALMPDHTGANNDLAYAWTDAGKNLDRAQAMIQKSIDNEPNNAAYLDSLGWLLYKQGRFDKAIPLFEKSITLPGGLEPEVVQHLADALYRSGQKLEAGERFHQADTLLHQAPPPFSSERQKVRTYLDAVLAALKSGKDPAITPIAKESPATTPLTGQAPTTAPAIAPH